MIVENQFQERDFTETDNSEVESGSDSQNPEQADKEIHIKTSADRNSSDLSTLPPYVYTGEFLLNMGITKMPYLVEPIIPKTGIISVAGSSDIGKSSFLRQLACAIATQKPDFLGFKITATHNRVYYVSTEDDIQSMAFLLHRQNTDKLNSSAFQNIGFIFDTEDLPNKLDESLTRAPADCIIIDTFTDIYGGELNITNKVRTFINSFGVVAHKHNCLLIFLHHTGKYKEELPPSKNNLLGSQGFEAKMRLVIELRKNNSVNGQRHLCIVKGNYLSSEFKEKSYVLYFDENQIFSNTGDRVYFNQLNGKPVSDLKDRPEYHEIIRLKNEGYSIRAIAKEMKKLGYQVGKTTVSNWSKDYDKPNELSQNYDEQEDYCPDVQPPKENMDDGQVN